MKTPSYLRISVALLTMTAIACSDPIVDPPPPDPKDPPVTSNNQGPYHTSVTTWIQDDYGRYTGLVTQTPNTDLSKADVFVITEGRTIAVDKELDYTSVLQSNGLYFWASYQNNVLFLHYIGPTVTSLPPYPLDVLIEY